MRGNEGKEFAVWLDHSGNYLRFREDWDQIYHEGVAELDDGKEKAKKEPTDKEKSESKCPSCGALWVPPSDICLSCGFVRERKNAVISIPGELQELNTGQTRQNKQEWWGMIRWHIDHAGWSPGRAAHTYKEKFGVFPRGLDNTVMLRPNQDVLNFIDQRLKAYIRSIKRGRK
jgi:ribosomal protein L32